MFFYCFVLLLLFFFLHLDPKVLYKLLSVFRGHLGDQVCVEAVKEKC